MGAGEMIRFFKGIYNFFDGIRRFIICICVMGWAAFIILAWALHFEGILKKEPPKWLGLDEKKPDD
jgi:hypothetical protein